MDNELGKLKVENWPIWQQAQASARRIEAAKSQSPALSYALLFAFMYMWSLFLFSSIVPALRNSQIEILIWSSLVGVVVYLSKREKEKLREELEDSIFKDLMSEKRKTAE